MLDEINWLHCLIFLAFWVYVGVYFKNRVQGRSAQMIGPVTVEPDSPRYLRVLVDTSAVASLLASIWVAVVLLIRTGWVTW